MREQQAEKLMLLKNEKGKKVPIYSIHNNPNKTNQFCTAGRDQYIRKVFFLNFLSYFRWWSRGGH